jgi:hypothetical protein
VVLQDDTDVRKGSPGLHSETCTVSPQDADHITSIKVEEVSDVEDEIVPVPVAWRMNTELEVSCMSDRYAELPVAFVCLPLLQSVYMKQFPSSERILNNPIGTVSVGV